MALGAVVWGTGCSREHSAKTSEICNLGTKLWTRQTDGRRMEKTHCQEMDGVEL